MEVETSVESAVSKRMCHGKDFSPYQQKIIKRYYENIDTISLQKLQELVGDIYLAEGAKATKMWAKAGEYLSKMKLPAKPNRSRDRQERSRAPRQCGQRTIG